MTRAMGCPRPRTIEPSNEDDTTILITAHYEDAQDSDALRQAIQNVCRRHGQDDLRVELVDGSVQRFASAVHLGKGPQWAQALLSED